MINCQNSYNFMKSRYETQNHWFQLPASNGLNLEKIQSYLSNKAWVDYSEYGHDFNGYSGIGLTSRSKSSEHINDSVKVPQSVGTFQKELENYNWQAISAWNENVSDYMKDLFERLNLKPLRARFSKIEPRSTVPRHIDDYSENITRIHWPVTTDEKNMFCFYSGDALVEKVHMEVGSCYAIDTSIPHAFFNFSKVTERIHLIINFPMSFSYFRLWIQKNELFKKSSID